MAHRFEHIKQFGSEDRIKPFEHGVCLFDYQERQNLRVEGEAQYRRLTPENLILTVCPGQFKKGRSQEALSRGGA